MLLLNLPHVEINGFWADNLESMPGGVNKRLFTIAELETSDSCSLATVKTASTFFTSRDIIAIFFFKVQGFLFLFLKAIASGPRKVIANCSFSPSFGYPS